ncbi:MAG: hypothetical protein HYW48_02270 [Deltaproteobacteria bacterium]|nr:hypothetical protein [Deltaproteobacteria bacterium]
MYKASRLIAVLALLSASCQVRKARVDDMPSIEKAAFLQAQASAETLAVKKVSLTPVSLVEGLNGLAISAQGGDAVQLYQMAVCTDTLAPQCDPTQENPYSFIEGVDDFPLKQSGVVNIFIRGCTAKAQTCGEWSGPHSFYQAPNDPEKHARLLQIYEHEARIREYCQTSRDVMRRYLEENPDAKETETGKMMQRQLDEVSPELCSAVMLSNISTELEKETSEKLTSTSESENEEKEEKKKSDLSITLERVYAGVLLGMGAVGFAGGILMTYRGFYQEKEWEAKREKQADFDEYAKWVQESSRLQDNMRKLSREWEAVQDYINKAVIDFNNKLQSLDADIKTPQVKTFLRRHLLPGADFIINPDRIADISYYQNTVLTLDNRLEEIQRGIWENYRATRSLAATAQVKWLGTNEKTYYDAIGTIRERLNFFKDDWVRRKAEYQDFKAWTSRQEILQVHIRTAQTVKLKPNEQIGWVNAGRVKKWTGVAMSLFSAVFTASHFKTLASLDANAYRLAEGMNLVSELAALYRKIKEEKESVISIRESLVSST